MPLLGIPFFWIKMKLKMKKILVALSFVMGCAFFTACSETSDCECSYGEGVYQYYDWTGSCSDIVFDLTKAEIGDSPFVCVEI